MSAATKANMEEVLLSGVDNFRNPEKEPGEAGG
jgi:hypothetical protein